MENIKANLIKGVYIVVKNQSNDQGYPEDDWSLCGFGATLEEAIDQAIEEELEDFGFYRLEELNIRHAYVEDHDFIYYEGKRFSEPRRFGSKQLDNALVWEFINACPAYIKLKNESEQRKQKRMAEQKAEQDKSDFQKYEELHARFEHPGE